MPGGLRRHPGLQILHLVGYNTFTVVSRLLSQLSSRYDRDGAFPFQCFLFSQCDRVEEVDWAALPDTVLDCAGLHPLLLRTGAVPRPGPHQLPPHTGGLRRHLVLPLGPPVVTVLCRYCFPDVGLGEPVPAGTKCIWQCPGQSLYHHCDNGEWSARPGSTRCMCQKIGTRHQGEVVCFPPVSMAEPVTSGTYCLHTCHGHTKTEMMCEHSLWSNSPASLSCEGGNQTRPPVGRSLKLEQVVS